MVEQIRCTLRTTAYICTFFYEGFMAINITVNFYYLLLTKANPKPSL